LDTKPSFTIISSGFRFNKQKNLFAQSYIVNIKIEPMPLDFSQLEKFLTAISQTDITELTIKEGDFELNLRKEVNTVVSPPVPVVATPILTETKVNLTTPEISAPTPIPPPENSSPPPPSSSPQWLEITSPMVGTFYRAPAPGEPPFVEVGDRISTGQVVCIIEAMKLMNEIEAEIAGEVMEIVAQNGEPVEYGQTLIRIKP
jgi:acetyl-CoA carboxylase biotin carboxyl carrier protein